MHPLHLARHLPPSLSAPIALRLDASRTARIDALLAEHPLHLDLLREALATLRQGPDREAETTIERYAGSLLSALRGDEGWAARLDRALASTGGEIMDQSWTPDAVKQREMALLDTLNRHMGSYAAWTRAVRGIVGAAPAHIVDLAAGSGGFLRHVARHEKMPQWRLTSTDLEALYVEQGRILARDENLDVRFAVQDALQLQSLADADLFVCTQSTHHLSPGMLVRLMAQAIGVAERGLLVIDLLRSAAHVAGALLVTSLVEPYPPLLADGMQSVRRAYLPSELRLLARLSGASRIDTQTVAPAFAVLHVRA